MHKSLLLVSCNSSAQGMLTCEAKLCSCSQKDDTSLKYESKPIVGKEDASKDWRRQCGCIKTSEKLKHLLKAFPTVPPPSPRDPCIANFCAHTHSCTLPVVTLQPNTVFEKPTIEIEEVVKKDKAPAPPSKSLQVLLELVQLVQLSVTATALALYYLIYCYMQLVYYTLRSALYFHNADGPMKVTIGVVTVTSLVVGFNLVLRMEKLIGIL